MNDSPSLSVTLHHLAPDATTAGIEQSDVALHGIGAQQLRTLLERLTRLAPKVTYPVAPEIRIAAPDGQFLVQVKEGHVRFSSWSVRAGGCVLTPDQIVATVTGAAPVGPGADQVPAPAATRGRARRWLTLSLLGAAILAANAATAWMLLRPPPTFLPPFELLEPEPARRVLQDAAGTYETGAAEGDRRLRIGADGQVQWVKYGPNKSVLEETPLRAQGARTGGRAALLASNQALIEVKDPMTLIFFGDLYRRVKP